MFKRDQGQTCGNGQRKKKTYLLQLAASVVNGTLFPVDYNSPRKFYLR